MGEGGACGVELLDGGRDYASGDELLLRDAELGGGGAADVTLAVGRVKRGLRPLPSVTRLLNRKAGRMRRTFRWEGAPMQNPLDALRAEARVRSATQVVSDMSSIEVRLWSASNWETLDGAFAGMGQVCPYAPVCPYSPVAAACPAMPAAPCCAAAVHVCDAC